jgi:hypothetical protein
LSSTSCPTTRRCGFGDNQHGSISNSLPAAAEQLGNTEALGSCSITWHGVMDKRAETGHSRQRSGKADAQPAGDDAEDKPHNIGYGTANTLLIKPDSIIGDAPAPRVKGAAA